DQARHAAASAKSATTATATAPGMAVPRATTGTAGAVASPSFAGIAPADADAIAMAHTAFPAELPAAPAGDVAAVDFNIQHRTISIAPGIRYEAWTFGPTVPGPVIHVRQGQLVKVTLHNTSPM